MKVILDKNAYMPERAHPTDAGYDLRCCENVLLYPQSSASFDTGVHVELPHGYYGKIESKSGLNVLHGIVSCGGVIDESYQGTIVVKLYNLGSEIYEFKKGDKIAQMVIQPYATPDEVGELELVEKFDDVTERGSKGFGSTGR